MKPNTYAPEETIIRYSKIKPLIENIIWLLIICFCIYYMIIDMTGIKYLLIIIVFFMCYGIYKNLRKSKQKSKIQLKLSNKGITLKNKSVIKWSNIKKAEVMVKPNFSNSIQKEYLIINTGKDKFEIFVNELDISSLRLEYLIKIYKGRFDKEIKS